MVVVGAVVVAATVVVAAASRRRRPRGSCQTTSRHRSCTPPAPPGRARPSRVAAGGPSTPTVPSEVLDRPRLRFADVQRPRSTTLSSSAPAPTASSRRSRWPGRPAGRRARGRGHAGRRLPHGRADRAGLPPRRLLGDPPARPSPRRRSASCRSRPTACGGSSPRSPLAHPLAGGAALLHRSRRRHGRRPRCRRCGVAPADGAVQSAGPPLVDDLLSPLSSRAIPSPSPGSGSPGCAARRRSPGARFGPSGGRRCSPGSPPTPCCRSTAG